MTDNLSILEAAIAIRPRLSELIGVEPGEAMAQKLDALLQQAQAGEPVEDAIWTLLTNTKRTQIWVTQFQQANPQPETFGQAKGLDRLPGEMTDIPSPKFKCPQCDYTWSRHSIGRPTPFCPTHNVILERLP
jgi:hypothetical protein